MDEAYKTQFVLDLLSRLDDELLRGDEGRTMSAALLRGDRAVLSALLARRACPPHEVEDGVSMDALRFCAEADGDGYFARDLLLRADWGKWYGAYRAMIAKAGTPASLGHAVWILGRMLIDAAPDFVVEDYAPRVLNHPGRRQRLRRGDDDIRFAGLLPTSLCSDRRRDALVAMGFRAETTASRVRAVVRRDASELVLSLASHHDGWHPDPALRQLTGRSWGDGEGALRRESRNMMVEDGLQYALVEWLRLNGQERDHGFFVLPARRLTDFDNVCNPMRYETFINTSLIDMEARLREDELRPER